MRAKLLVVATTIAGLIGMSAGVAEALAPGDVAIQNQADSGSWLDVRMVNAQGSFFDVNVNPGQRAGEPSYAYQSWEPWLYYIRTGWCWKEYTTYNGTTTEVSGPYGPLSYGTWHDANPGSGFIGVYVKHVKTWNC